MAVSSTRLLAQTRGSALARSCPGSLSHTLPLGRPRPRQARGASFSVTAAASSSSAAPVHILGISGSLRAASTNSGLLRAAQELLPDNTTLAIAQIGDLPLFNSDLVVDDVQPEPVARLHKEIKAADAILFASPEYDYLVTPAMKNALDWCSRAPDNAWNDKPAAVMGAGGAFGTALGCHSLRQSAVFLNLHLLNKPELLVKRFQDPTMFDERGNLVSEKIRGRVQVLVEALVAWTRRLRV